MIFFSCILLLKFVLKEVQFIFFLTSRPQIWSRKVSPLEVKSLTLYVLVNTCYQLGVRPQGEGDRGLSTVFSSLKHGGSGVGPGFKLSPQEVPGV